jgi:lysophospholipase L1-like esterase
MLRIQSLLALTAALSLSTACVVEEDDQLSSIEQESVNPKASGYVSLGASITFGVGATNFVGHTDGFAEYLELAVFGNETDFVNLAVPGATSGEVLLDQLEPAIPFVATHKQDGLVVSVAGGGNDLLQFLNSPDFAICFQPDPTACFLTLGGILAQVDANLDAVVSKLREVGGTVATLGNAALEGIPGTPLVGLNNVIRGVAARHGALVAEVFLPFASNPDAFVGPDCVHPTDAGYDVLLGVFSSLL